MSITRISLSGLIGLGALLALAPASGQAQDWTPPPAKEGFSYPDCFCSNRGQLVPLGGLACLTVGDRVYLAQCKMSLNNPVWREVQDGCPSARLQGGPAADPGSAFEAPQSVEPG